jgi:hypothetical protein
MYKYANLCKGAVTLLRGQAVAITGKVYLDGEHVKRDLIARQIQVRGRGLSRLCPVR